MESQPYRHLVCATRGGEASRATEDKAIEIAQESGGDLTFLYVVDPELPEVYTAMFGPELVAEGLRDIGRVILELAQKRAAAQGVPAHTALRQGRVHEEIERYITEHSEVDLLVVGHLSDELRSHLGPFLARMADGGQHVLEVKHHPEQ